MDETATQPEQDQAAVPFDEVAFGEFINSPRFDDFLPDCFEQGIRVAAAEELALGLRKPPAP